MPMNKCFVFWNMLSLFIAVYPVHINVIGFSSYNPRFWNSNSTLNLSMTVYEYFSRICHIVKTSFS